MIKILLTWFHNLTLVIYSTLTNWRSTSKLNPTVGGESNCLAITAKATHLSQKYAVVATASSFLKAGAQLNCAVGSEPCT